MKIPVLEFLFNNVLGLKVCKDSKAGVSYEFFENFKNTYFEEHLRTTGSNHLRKISPLLVLGKAIR